MNSFDFVDLTEASLENLLELRAKKGAVDGLEFYRECLIAFYLGDSRRLDQWIQEYSSNNPCKKMAQLRKLLLDGTVTAEALAIEAESDTPESPWAAEHSMLIGSGYVHLGHHADAIIWLRKASAEFEALGAHGKAVRAEFNALVSKGHLDPKARLIFDYYRLYRKAKRAKQSVVAATALLNISKEYHQIGAIKLALKLAESSVEACEDNFGTDTYTYCLAHRALIYLELGAHELAARDIEEVKLSPFPSARAALEVLFKLYPEIAGATITTASATDNGGSQLHPGWKDRLQVGLSARAALGELEESLISILSDGPKEKFEICDRLFGKDFHPFVTENRLKNVIWRIRQKRPDLVVYRKGLYFLDEEQLTEHKSA